MLYLSPSSTEKWRNRQAWFKSYAVGALHDLVKEVELGRPLEAGEKFRAPGWPQTIHMAVGCGFDMWVKEKITGVKQKESRDTVWVGDAKCSEVIESVCAFYERMGRLAAWNERSGGQNVKCEQDVRGIIEGVPLMGKPDAWWIEDGVLCLHDWKVSGWVEKNGKVTAPNDFWGMIGEVNGQVAWVDRPRTQGVKKWHQQLRYYARILGQEGQKVRYSVEWVGHRGEKGPAVALYVCEEQIGGVREWMPEAVEIRQAAEYYYWREDLPAAERLKEIEARPLTGDWQWEMGMVEIAKSGDWSMFR